LGLLQRPARRRRFLRRLRRTTDLPALPQDGRRAGAATGQGQLSIYDLRTNQDFTLKQNPLSRSDLDEFVACYNPANRHQRTATWSDANPDGRWRAYPYEQLIARDKANLDIFWLRDDSLEDSASLPDPDVLAAEIMEDLQAVLTQFSLILGESET
jgi:type I restriction enzyme M protein